MISERDIIMGVQILVGDVHLYIFMDVCVTFQVYIGWAKLGHSHLILEKI